MKKYFIVPGMALVVFASFSTSASALSCLDPEGMNKFIVEEQDYVVVTATPAQQKEFVKQEVDATDPNMMYPEGYTGQFIEIKESHKGAAPDSQWVYFTRNGTWNYLCAGEPPKLNSENIYVINTSTNIFEPSTVVATYAKDSDMAKNLLKTLDTASEEVEEGMEPSVYEVPKADWLQRLHDELKEMAFIVKLKLAEWNFWLAK